MVWLDGLILLGLLAATVRGSELGFVRQLFSAIGFFGGLFLGAWLSQRYIVSSDLLASLGLMLGCALGALVFTEALAHALKSRMRLRAVDAADRWLGSAVAGVAILIAVWLGASIFSSAPYPALQRQIQDSAIIGRLAAVLPDAPKVISAFGHLVTANGFPEVFTGAEPTPETVEIPDMGELTAAVNKTKNSVVKVEGEGCGGIVDGSGFVAADNLVVTNAHVVAGVAHPKIIDKNGTHKATVLSFDPDLDIAILRSIDLAGEPLGLSDQIAADGTKAAVMGYPGGGGFKADPAAIIDAFTAKGKNIYDQNTTIREIYSMQATVISGNSGGPVIDSSGQVIGVVFAQSVTYESVGYSLTMPKVIAQLEQAKHSSQAVATGKCAR